MQIVIDINDKEYFKIMSEGDGDITSYLTTVHLYDAIRKNSIPLPKGHGELKDTDAIYNRIDTLNRGKNKGKYTEVLSIITCANTIIEADKDIKKE